MSLDHDSSSSPRFLQSVAEILERIGEIFVVFRFHKGAGSRSYEFFDSAAAFVERLGTLPPQTSVIVFNDAQLPVRGIADESLIRAAKAEIPDGSYWAVVRTTPITMGSQTWFHDIEDDSHDELEDELRGEFCWGHPVAVGLDPDWFSTDSVVAAITPFPDGSVKPGIY